ncbi:MAG: arginine--tRNA ligase, partial [Parcubacteria group bacterium]|nr:arginine--tRNA ligase [Parcubacteria group bacterium]
FVNFRLAPDFLRKKFSRRPSRPKKRLETVVIDYSSPNIGKPLSIAHFRSTIIGDALARIYEALGYKVITDNHLGDWGLQMGILIAAIKLFSEKAPNRLSIQEMLELYVKFNAMVKEHDELKVKAKLETMDLQNGVRESLRIWQEVSRKGLREFEKGYRLLGIRKFDLWMGESKYRDLIPWVVQEALRKKVARRSEGAIIIPVERKGCPPVIIQKSDGGHLYHTFDLATIHWRAKHLKPTKVLYVVANEQALRFEQLFVAAEKLGWTKGELVHVKFGMVRGEDMKRLSTRGGKTVSLDAVVQEAVSRARAVVEGKNPGLSQAEKQRIARMVGVGALKYNDLSQNRNTDIVFDWDRMLDFQGNSAPYLQYTYARLRSIRRKIKNAELRMQNVDLELLQKPEEIALMKKVLQFPEAVEDAAQEYAPNLLANYLWELANLANTFYEKYPVLKAEKGVREARLMLTTRVADTLRRGLLLLGIEALERV